MKPYDGDVEHWLINQAMPTFCKLHHLEQTSVKLESKLIPLNMHFKMSPVKYPLFSSSFSVLPNPKRDRTPYLQLYWIQTPGWVLTIQCHYELSLRPGRMRWVWARPGCRNALGGLRHLALWLQWSQFVWYGCRKYHQKQKPGSRKRYIYYNRL